MTQVYSNPKREDDPWALPDVEVFFRAPACDEHGGRAADADGSCHECAMLCGWYWWSCFSGCLPDGDATGPFATEQEAVADAQDRENEL